MSEKEVDIKSDLAKQEEEILAFWKEHGIFHKTLAKQSPAGEFVFYEGPPTANAAPALHHLEARAFKDIIPRYKTMRGYHVRRKGGWDTHGLPVELQVEKKLGLTSKKEIEQYGVALFNKECRASVWGHIDTWGTFTDRIGYWVDQKEAYVTYHNTYIESLWNIISEVNKKGLLYKDYRVVPWCTRCGTALSSHELAQGYQDITDISVYVKFKVVGEENTYLLAWTTTPWTLPGNVGLAVGKDIEYVKVKKEDGPEQYILAKDRLSTVFSEEKYSVIGEMKGSELTSLSYEPLYPFLKHLAKEIQGSELEKAFKVYEADFVTTTDGTGIVHTAVMYGQEDFELGSKIGLPKYHLVSPDGLFIPGTDFLAGKYVRDLDTTIEILRDLEARHILFKKEKYKHSYPHCWRCKTALIYYARDSWYIRMSSLRAELQAENQKINWEPSHIKEGRFGEWLREAKDWAISRERYWGTPLPAWQKKDGSYVVVDSLDTLKKYTKKSGNTYTVMRHGQTGSNVKELWSCDSETPDPLTEDGRKQVIETAQKLKGTVDIIICSPYPRTKETAYLVAQEIGLSSDQVIYDARVGEWNIGTQFDHRPYQEYFNARKQSTNPYEFKTEDGESYLDVVRRVGEFIYAIEQTYSGKRILVVTHGAPARGMFMIAEGHPRSASHVHAASFRNFDNAEARTLPFVPLPHNEVFELDVHRPYIDEVALVDEQGYPMKRTPEVMDVWFDSGAMPFAQDHYPFENKEWIEGRGYPADFISEAIDQTRGWFYTLLAVGVLMGRGTPYKNVVCLGHILDKEGKKMSKSVGNVVNPWLLMDTYGVDALRLWMYSVNQPGDSKNFDEKTVDEVVKKIFNPLSNCFVLVDTYRHAVKRVDPYSSPHILDRWILSKLSQLIQHTTESLETFKIFEPVRDIRDFVQDFSTWYIRRSRDRFKDAQEGELSWSLSVAEHVLLEVSKLLAPFAPFYGEYLYRQITKGTHKESVHLEDWPTAHTVDEELLANMEHTREVVSSLLLLRQKAGMKVRQPLASVTLDSDLGTDLMDIIKDELNVKEVHVGAELSIDTTLTQELFEEGVVRDFIRGIQDARKKENLVPSQMITLTVYKGDMTLIDRWKTLITTPTGIQDIVQSSGEGTYTVESGEHIFSFSIKV